MVHPAPSTVKKMRLAALLCVFFVLYLIASRRSAPTNPPNRKEQAPVLSGQTLDGKTLSLSGLAGNVVLVDFWATWCDPCREEIPDLVKLRDRLKAKGFEILGVSMDEEGARAVKIFTARQPISYPLILNDGERPPAGWVVPGLPTAYLIGRRGELLKKWFGEKDMRDLEKDVTAALAK